MTPAERNALHLRISTAIEPKPTTQLAFGSTAVSDLKAWRWAYTYSGVGLWTERDWTGDETASGLLMDMMPRVCLRSYGDDPDYGGWVCLTDNVVSSSDALHYADRKTAIALAAAEWLEGRKR